MSGFTSDVEPQKKWQARRDSNPQPPDLESDEGVEEVQESKGLRELADPACPSACPSGGDGDSTLAELIELWPELSAEARHALVTLARQARH